MERRAAICPTSQLQTGNYKTPTYVILGSKDEIASFEAAANFQEELERHGIESEVLGVKDADHLHDLLLKSGMPGWDEQVAPGIQSLFDALRDLTIFDLGISIGCAKDIGGRDATLLF